MLMVGVLAWPPSGKGGGGYGGLKGADRRKKGRKGPLSDVCQLTSGCKNKWGLWRQMKRGCLPGPTPPWHILTHRGTKCTEDRGRRRKDKEERRRRAELERWDEIDGIYRCNHVTRIVPSVSASQSYFFHFFDLLINTEVVEYTCTFSIDMSWAKIRSRTVWISLFYCALAILGCTLQSMKSFYCWRPFSQQEKKENKDIKMATVWLKLWGLSSYLWLCVQGRGVGKYLVGWGV